MGKKKTKKVLKYFELPLEFASKWDTRDYVIFILEALWQTVFPFLAGMILVSRGEIIWIFMLILPIYFRLRIEKKEGMRTRKIYVK